MEGCIARVKLIEGDASIVSILLNFVAIEKRPPFKEGRFSFLCYNESNYFGIFKNHQFA